MRQDLELRSIDPQRLSTCAFHRLAWRVYSAGNAKPSILKANETENGAGEQGPGLGKIIEAGQVLVGFQVVEGDETHWHTVESA
jgi:hypothetical protein